MNRRRRSISGRVVGAQVGNRSSKGSWGLRAGVNALAKRPTRGPVYRRLAK